MSYRDNMIRREFTLSDKGVFNLAFLAVKLARWYVSLGKYDKAIKCLITLEDCLTALDYDNVLVYYP